MSVETIKAIAELWKLGGFVVLLILGWRYHKQISIILNRLNTGKAHFERGDTKGQIEFSLDKPATAIIEKADSPSTQPALTDSKTLPGTPPTSEAEVELLKTEVVLNADASNQEGLREGIVSAMKAHKFDEADTLFQQMLEKQSTAEEKRIAEILYLNPLYRTKNDSKLWP